jgi:hypothetical protein
MVIARQRQQNKHVQCKRSGNKDASVERIALQEMVTTLIGLSAEPHSIGSGYVDQSPQWLGKIDRSPERGGKDEEINT